MLLALFTLSILIYSPSLCTRLEIRGRSSLLPASRIAFPSSLTPRVVSAKAAATISVTGISIITVCRAWRVTAEDRGRSCLVNGLGEFGFRIMQKHV